MDLQGKQVILCNCESTMPLKEGELSKACRAVGGEGEISLNNQLCRSQLGNYQAGIIGDKPVLVACTQEAPLFTEIAQEDNPLAQVSFTNIRERAGWSDEAENASPKIAALLAEAALEIEPTPIVSYESKGLCLVYGDGEIALEAAQQLKSRLEVTVLLRSHDNLLPPRVMVVPIFRGTITGAKGHLGNFGITVNGYAPSVPSARSSLVFDPPRDNAFSECDLILDLCGDIPLFPAKERRDGYFRPDPNDPIAVQKALFEIADLVGEFDKPRYVLYDPDICTHSRSHKTGCTRCLDVCPTSAIEPDGDHVRINPHVCAGCGACASVCPTGAATYQLPGGDSLLQRLRTLLTAYGDAGGEQAALLLHDSRHGEEMISMIARLGRGLPARVLPFALNEITQVGLDFFAAAFAYGANQVAIIAGPSNRNEMDGLASQIGLVESVMDGLGYGGGRIHVLDEPDPDKVATALYGLAKQSEIPRGSFLPMGGKRTRSFLALRHLHDKAPSPVPILPLAPGAPFGTVTIDREGCTLCLACVGACPTGALRDDENQPLLGFNEEACVQCGLCRATCPESVMTLEPRINFTEDARGVVTLNEAEPYECIRCGKPFGVKQSIERIVEKLAGKHHMFAGDKQIDKIRMCEDCRVIVQMEDPVSPMAHGTRPQMRTTDDYLREREIEEAREKVRQEKQGLNGNGRDDTD